MDYEWDCYFYNIELSDKQTSINLWIGGFCALLSLIGSIINIILCNRAKKEFVFAKLTFFVAIWDTLFIISNFFINLVVIGPWCDFLTTVQIISINFSLSCTVMISVSCLGTKRKDFTFFLRNYNKWLLGLYALCLGHGLTSLYFTLIGKNYHKFFFYWQIWPSSAFVLFVVFCNLKLLYVLKKNKIDLRDRTPVYFTVVMVLVFGWGVGTAWYNFYVAQSAFTIMSVLWLQEISGFIGFAVSYQRIRKAIDSIEIMDSSSNTHSIERAGSEIDLAAAFR